MGLSINIASFQNCGTERYECLCLPRFTAYIDVFFNGEQYVATLQYGVELSYISSSYYKGKTPKMAVLKAFDCLMERIEGNVELNAIICCPNILRPYKKRAKETLFILYLKPNPMNPTKEFKTVIQNYLEQLSQSDPLFAASFSNPQKSIDNCITYILNTVKKSGCNGFADDEIFSMAVHYYDEEDIEVGKSIDCKVVVNHTVELTEDEKQQARRDAIKRIEDEVYAKLKQQRGKNTAKRTVTTEQPQATLFDF